MRRLILFFVKYPEPGKVKTRLAATIGAEAAAAVYRQLVQTIARILGSGQPVRVLFSPAEKRQEIREWLAPMLPGAEFAPQSSGDLGERLERAFDAAFSDGWQQVAVIGSDCIELSAGIFAETWKALAADDVVIGPTEDGGYYLLALRDRHPGLFHGIAWSTGDVFAQTRQQAVAAGLRVHLLPRLHDVDTGDDWQRARARM
jgi:rSAM/selenodomain-associated transferase 1